MVDVFVLPIVEVWAALNAFQAPGVGNLVWAAVNVNAITLVQLASSVSPPMVNVNVVKVTEVVAVILVPLDILVIQSVVAAIVMKTALSSAVMALSPVMLMANVPARVWWSA